MNLREYARRVSDFVSSPEYYTGPWRVDVGGWHRVCPNHATARAWAMYFRRRGFWYATVQKVTYGTGGIR